MAQGLFFRFVLIFNFLNVNYFSFLDMLWLEICSFLMKGIFFYDNVDKFTVDKFTHYSRPTQSIMYVPLQVNGFQNSVLLIVQYKYLKSCFGDFYSPESDLPHKIMRYWFYYSI